MPSDQPIRRGCQSNVENYRLKPWEGQGGCARFARMIFGLYGAHTSGSYSCKSRQALNPGGCVLLDFGVPAAWVPD